MEVVGGVASIITLIEATGVLIEVSKKLISRWQNAPHEIQALATRLSLLAAELHSIKNATSTSHPVLTDAIIRQSLSDLLTDVRKRLMKLESLHYRLEQYKPVYQRIRWTVKDADSVEKMLSKTQEVEQRLANLMTLISLKAQTPILDGLDRIEQMVSTLVISLPASIHGAPVTSTQPVKASDTMQRTRCGRAATRTLAISTWGLDRGWAAWGLGGSRSTTRYASHIDQNINFWIVLPFKRILGNYALIGTLSLQTTPICRGFLTLRHPSYFVVARVVDKDHPFMMACKQGDVETVRFMLRNGEGRPTDVTVDGDTPVYFAVCATSIEVIAKLIEYGLDVDAIADTYLMRTALGTASSLKDLDTTRFLLQNGASLDHRDVNGVQPSALCWLQNDHLTNHSSMDLCKLFIEHGAFEQDGTESYASSIIELVCTSACDEQINQLIDLGADVHQNSHIGAAPIHLAAYSGNYSAYSALVSRYDDTFFDVYLRFATILGVAESARRNGSTNLRPGQHGRILSDLLRRGVNPDERLQLTCDNFCWIGSSTSGCETSMNEVAASFHPDANAWYMNVVALYRYDKAQSGARVLREPTAARQCSSGFVYEVEQKSSEMSSDFRRGTDDSCGDGDGDIDGEAHTDSEDDYPNDTDSEIEQFWDANETIQ